MDPAVTPPVPLTTLPEAEAVEVAGVKYILFKNRDLLGRAVRAGKYELELIEVARVLLSDRPGGVVVDVGANIGTFTLPLAKAFAQHRFECFEVQRVVYHQLCGGIALNALANVRARNVGLSDARESVEVAVPDYTTESNVGAFSLDDDVRANGCECASVGATERIELFTLDALAVRNVRLVKLDVEGMEERVLKGALETLRASNFPPLIFETWTSVPWYQPRRAQLHAWLTGLGYEITEVRDNNIAQHRAYGPRYKFEFEFNP